MTIEELRQKGLVVLECISGSKAYGLDTPSSDTDLKGVFVLPKSDYYGLDYVQQINNSSNDEVFYELGRFMDLLSVNNPNILELLNTPPHAILYKHPFMDAIRPEIILSKLCRETFGRFAYAQIRKAKGLKKKILNPIDVQRKTILSFCYVSYNNGSVSLPKFLELKGWLQEDCGLVNVSNMKDVYGLYHAKNLQYSGIMSSEEANEVCLSTIPKDQKQEALLYFGREAYSSYCKEYREYWEWVSKRNEVRYENTQQHGKNYDAKNMMHVFRLLDMAIEIAQTQQVNVLRSNRDFLLHIKEGHYEYKELLKMAEYKQQEMEVAFEASMLPASPNRLSISRMTYEIREKFYNLQPFNH